MSCELESRLSAYYDGELSPAERTVVESHLTGCGDCREALAGLQETSALFAAQKPAGLSQIARHRLHNALDRQMERGLVRLSWAMSGIAAVIVVAGSLWLHVASEKSATAPPLAKNNITFDNSASTPAEQYYLADATTRTVEDY